MPTPHRLDTDGRTGAIRSPARLHGALVVDTITAERKPTDTDELQARLKSAEKLAVQQAVLVGMLAELLSASSLDTALDALAGALKARFGCDRVGIALVNGDELTLRAISQQAVLDASSSEARLLVDAMREACDRESIVCWPAVDERLGVQVAHRALAGRRLSGSICSVPLYDDAVLVGAFLLERRDRREFPVANLERLAVCIAPLLALRGDADRSALAVLRQRSRRLLTDHLHRLAHNVRSSNVASNVRNCALRSMGWSSLLT